MWKNKEDKIKRNVVCQPLENGGLNFINFVIMVKSLRLAWIARLISNYDDNLDCEQSLFFFRFSESNARAREGRSRETRETRVQPEKKKERLLLSQSQ